MAQERSAKLVVQGQRIRQPAHEGGAPYPGGLGVGPTALSAVHAGRARDDAPFARTAGDHLAVAQELLAGEVLREAPERQASICVHGSGRAGKPFPHRFLTVV